MTAVMEQVGTVKPRTRRRVVLAGLTVLVLGAAVVAVLYRTVPKGNAGDGPVDALVVLGTPADLHGEVTPMQRWRVDEAVREFQRGQAPRIVFAGGPTANRYAEADVMAAYARSLGVPAGAIFEERSSHTTLQNIANTTALLREHGWQRVEVISSRQHLPRASVLLAKTGLQWRVHAAPTPGWSRDQIDIAYVEEAFGTAMMRIFGRHAEPVLHGLAMVQHGVAWCVRTVMYKVEGWLGR